MAERSMKPVIVVHPDSANAAVRKTLTRAGYVVVEGDASHFRVLDVLPIASLDLITHAALTAVVEGRETQRFGMALARARMVGNSVCPPLAAALVRANAPELRARDEVAA